jgi:hypothetical protein
MKRVIWIGIISTMQLWTSIADTPNLDCECIIAGDCDWDDDGNVIVRPNIYCEMENK